MFGSKHIQDESGKDMCKKLQSLDKYFDDGRSREEGVLAALQDGHTATSIARHLGLSNPTITKIVKRYREKRALFEKLKKKGIFWSYSKDLEYNEKLLIEYTLKYADFDDIKNCFEIFGKRAVKRVWEKSMQSDDRFIKTNLMIARIFLKMDIEAEDLKGMKIERFEKFRLLAS